jgi:TonB family protein
VCQLAEAGKGLGAVTVVQFEARADADEDLHEAIEILQIIAPALVSAGHFFIGFHGSDRWDMCRTRSPEIVFWRDYDDNWRRIVSSPVRYLTDKLTDLPAELHGTPAEAYVLFSLGSVERRIGRERRSIGRLERAYDILFSQGDPQGISTYVLVQLIQYHFGEQGDEAKGQRYLDAYAVVAADTPWEDDYLPLIKVPPAYPASAYEARVEGEVLLEFMVTSKGTVVNPVVVRSDPPGVFDDAAIEAAKSFRYVPRVVDGRAVDVKGVRNRISFEIR